jgi:hypothetical protein
MLTGFKVVGAHRLYEWFGFVRMPQVVFVLRKQL